MTVDSIAHVYQVWFKTNFYWTKTLETIYVALKQSLEYELCRWQWNTCREKITLLANISNSLEMQLRIKFTSYKIFKYIDS